MTTLKTVLCVVASAAWTLLGAGLIEALHEVSSQRQTGLGAVAGGLSEALLSVKFWLLTAVLFYLFFRASRLSSKALRILLFWTPTLFITTLGACVIVLFIYLRVHAKHLASM